MKRRHAILRSLAAAIAFPSTIPVARAQSDQWPSRPITLVLPASAGSGTDLMARQMANRLGQALRQPVVVDNKPGASGVIGTSMVTKANPDGYTLLYTNGSNTVMAPALVKNLPYDVTRDLLPIAQTAVGGVLLLVNKDFPARNLRELIDYIKANPGKFTYGSWAVGSSGHLVMEWLKKQTGMQIEHVAYRQVTTLLSELSTGILNVAWADPISPLPFIDSGKVRGIAIIGNTRAPRTANIATMAEQGYPFESVGWFGMFAPAGTPPAIMQRLTDEVNRIQGQPEMAAMMNQLNLEPPPVKTAAQFRGIVANDLQVWKKIVTDAGITLEN